MPRTTTLVHEESGSLLINVEITGMDEYVNIPGFTFHEPLAAYLAKGWTEVVEPLVEVAYRSPHHDSIGTYGQSSANGWLCRACGWLRSGGVGAPRSSIESQHDTDMKLEALVFRRFTSPWLPVTSTEGVTQ